MEKYTNRAIWGHPWKIQKNLEKNTNPVFLKL